MLGHLFSLSWVGTSLETAVDVRRTISLPKWMARIDVCGAGSARAKFGSYFN